METFKNLFQKKNRLIIIGVALFILCAYILASIFVLKYDPVRYWYAVLEHNYLLVYEKFANLLLSVFNSDARINNHIVYKELQLFDGFLPELRYKKWMFLFLFLIWITKAPAWGKLKYSLILLFAHFIVISATIAFGANLCIQENPNYSLLAIPLTVAFIVLVSIFFVWYKKNKENLLSRLSKIKIESSYLKNNKKVFTVIYLYILLTSFIIEYFDFKLWVRFILSSASKILALFDYHAIVEPFRLAGIYGNIYLVKGCLGFQTMFLFAILVFLTGRNNALRWYYIAVGLIFLNFLNILRFVVLFMHIESNKGMYLLGIELHDFYNYVIYAVVFLLWILWFEKFAHYNKSHEQLSGK